MDKVNYYQVYITCHLVKSGILISSKKDAWPPCANDQICLVRSMPNNCKQVITFATKVRNPAVGVFTFVIFRGITWSQTWASLLFSFAVTAAVFNPDFLRDEQARYWPLFCLLLK